MPYNMLCLTPMSILFIMPRPTPTASRHHKACCFLSVEAQGGAAATSSPPPHLPPSIAAQISLRRCATNEEPLVDGAVDFGGREVLVGGKGRKLVGSEAARRVGDGDVGTGRVSTGIRRSLLRLALENSHGDTVGRRLAGDETLPGIGALANHFHGVSAANRQPPATCQPRQQNTHSLFLHSPVKANWFSGLPSGIL